MPINAFDSKWPQGCLRHASRGIPAHLHITLRPFSAFACRCADSLFNRYAHSAGPGISEPGLMQARKIENLEKMNRKIIKLKNIVESLIFTKCAENLKFGVIRGFGRPWVLFGSIPYHFKRFGQFRFFQFFRTLYSFNDLVSI